MGEETGASSLVMRLYASFLALIAAALLYGGGQLAALGGSLYYVIAGLALAVSAVLIWRRQREGMWLYIAILALTVVWALWEVGFHGWALMPRLVAWFVVGAWMLTPGFRRNLKSAVPRARPVERIANWGGLASVFAAAVVLGALAHQLRPDAVDPKFQAGIGPFPSDRAVVSAIPDSGEWPHWGNTQGGSRFSSLTQITPENVGKLELAWSAELGSSDSAKGSGLEVTPLMVGGTLYACNQANQVFAIDAETGKELWHVTTAEGLGRTCRGVAYYRVPDAAGPCAERILTTTGAATLVALDAQSGERCAGFGNNGAVNLLEGMSIAPRGYYHVTSAPAVVRGKVVFGGWVSDGQFWGEPSGVIRAYDAVTGALAWAWDIGRPDRTGAPPPGETYTPATPNSWAPISADETLGLVYIPTGNATPDYFGGNRRPIDDQFSSSVVALDAETGRERWSFQTAHHDLWDYDVASQPTLADLPGPDGSTIPVVIQSTKRGEIFVLNRATGQLVFPVVEKPAPQNGKVPEERLSPTQPFSDALPSFRGAKIRESDMWGITPLDQIYCRIKFREARYEGTLTPPGLSPWIASPGYIGGMDWGSATVDVDHDVMVVNTNKLANYNRLMTRAEADAIGLKPFGDDVKSVEYRGAHPMAGTPYASSVSPFLSPLYVPCQAPPYGFLNAIDLVTGKLIWSRTIGNARDMGPLGIPSHLPLPLGTPTTGGAITTRSGLIFIGATQDRMFRAVDIRTGKVLWSAHLPRGGFADPMTYTSPKSGRQFVVIAAGSLQLLGHNDGATLMAYALPKGK